MTSTISISATFDFEPPAAGVVGWGREKTSLNTGEARERRSEWTLKSRLGGPVVRRMMSASGASNFSVFDIVVVASGDVVGKGGSSEEIETLGPIFKQRRDGILPPIPP